MFRFLRSNTVEFYGLNRMSLFKSYWTVEGISPDARDAAIRAADADGEELGAWLSQLINKVSLAERDAAAVVQDSVEDVVEDAVEETAEDTGEETAEDTVEDTVEAVAEDPDDKMSSIERAMLQPRAAGDAGAG
jgi:hypothetical protein